VLHQVFTKCLEHPLSLTGKNKRQFLSRFRVFFRSTVGVLNSRSNPRTEQFHFVVVWLLRYFLPKFSKNLFLSQKQHQLQTAKAY